MTKTKRNRDKSRYQKTIKRKIMVEGYDRVCVGCGGPCRWGNYSWRVTTVWKNSEVRVKKTPEVWRHLSCLPTQTHKVTVKTASDLTSEERERYGL